MTTVDLPVSHIFTRPDARKIDDANVTALAASIAEIGVINPLRVRPAQRHVEGMLTDAYEVTAGAHRLSAARRVGLETVPCIVVQDDDLHAELAMIDENLMRAELSPADRAKQTARRKAIYEELHPEARAGAVRAAGMNASLGNNVDEKFSPTFTADTAAKLGKSERIIQLDAERGNRVASDVLDRVRGTHLDTGAYLDKIKRLPIEDQRARVERDLVVRQAPKLVSPPPDPLNDAEARDRWLSQGMAWWDKGSGEWREEFLRRVEAPVMPPKWGAS